MDQENYEFSRVEFLNELKKEFLENINRYAQSKGIKPEELPYKDFKNQVHVIQAKFWSISREKKGKRGTNFSPKLWGCFFALTVVPYRKKYYPEVQAKIQALHKSAQKAKNPK